MTIEIRSATTDDAGPIADIINGVVDEGGMTSLRRFTGEEEREFIASMGDREAIFVAVVDDRVVGFQGISRFAQWSDSMAHVANVLTMVLPGHRRQGIGMRLAETTLAFAREKGYEKISTYVVAANAGALAYYERLGFRRVGRWERQVKLDGRYFDDVIVEMFL